MRLAFLLLASTLLATMPGCLEDDDVPEPTDDAPPMVAENATLPADIMASETVMGSADPMNFVTGGVCESPTAQCFEYPFTIEGNQSVNVDGTLTWGLEANDFDLYVYEGNTEALNGASDVTAGPGTMEHVEGPLEPGEYRVIVVAWGVGQDTFDLAVTFSA